MHSLITRASPLYFTYYYANFEYNEYFLFFSAIVTPILTSYISMTIDLYIISQYFRINAKKGRSQHNYYKCIVY